MATGINDDTRLYKKASGKGPDGRGPPNGICNTRDNGDTRRWPALSGMGSNAALSLG